VAAKPFWIAGFAFLCVGVLLNVATERWSLPLRLEPLLPPIAVWLCVTGALLLLWAMRPLKSSPLFSALFISTCFACLYGVFFLVVEMTDKGPPEELEELQDCDGPCQTVAATVKVPRSAFDSSKPAVFCQTAMFGMFLKRYDVILVYGVTERSEQDRALKSLSEYRRRIRTKPIRVQFYEKENVTPFHNKEGKAISGSGQRGPERLIRVATVP
jgi:hypothetical protein